MRGNLDLSHLNAPQRKAVKATDGRILVLAGAGSGKTSVITHRIAYLLAEKGISPEEILGMTFTNKAAEEMRIRIANLIGKESAKMLSLCTFHSFCMGILRKEIHHLGYTNSFSLYDERDIHRLLNQLSQDAKLPEKKDAEIIKKLYEQLDVCLRAYNAVDFDRLISLTVKLFQQFPEVLNRYSFRYVMIDEYQDTNATQFMLADLLAQKHGNLFVVGDDDQSIYGWRGAEIKHILEFPSTAIIKLQQNYRSTPLILKGANHVIRNNKERHEKELWSAKESGEPIHIFHAPTEQDEIRAVIDRMLVLRQEKQLKWKDMAILYRSNLLSRGFEMELLRASWKKDGHFIRGIPYQIFGGMELYERSEIKDLTAYLKTIVNPFDQEAILRIINFPRRGISSNTLDILTQENRKKGISLWELLIKISKVNSLHLTKAAEKGIADFVSLIETSKRKFASGSLFSALEELLETISFKEALKDEIKSEKGQITRWENVREYVELLKFYEETENHPSLHHFLLTTLLDDSRKGKKKKHFDEDRVSLMTFHSAKGLEFSACFLVCLEDHIIPHEKSLMETGLEEERRLMYVAMTRAKNYLTLSMARKRKRYGKDQSSNPSRFLFEIPKEYLKMSSWDLPRSYE